MEYLKEILFQIPTRLLSQNDRGRPRRKQIGMESFTYSIKQNYNFVRFFVILWSSQTVLTSRYKGQWSPCPIPIRVWIRILCSYSRTYIQQCTLKRQCTTNALVANTQLHVLYCFRLETHN